MHIDTPITLRDRLIISAKYRRDKIEYLRFAAIIKALILDKTNAQQVNEFNELMQKLSEAQSNKPPVKAKTIDDVRNLMKDFDTKFPQLKVKKVKNFKKAT